MFLDLDGRIREANAALGALLGHRQEHFVGLGLAALAAVDDRGLIPTAVEQLVAGNVVSYEAEHLLTRSDGSQVWAMLDGSLVQDEHGRPSYLVFQVSDLTARKEAEFRLAHQAVHDDLTGLPNRVLLHDHIEQACARAERVGTHVAVLFVDLDDFKDINDTFGHLVGDEVLTEVAGRLAGCLRGTDTAARIGGDEFVLVCGDLDDPDEASAVALRVEAAFGSPVFLSDGRAIEVNASIGITTASGTTAPEELLGSADIAMYRAKINGKHRHEVYEPGMRVSAVRQSTLAHELEAALSNEQFRLYYQPMYDTQTGAMVAVEALLRWQHPTRGLLSPAHFLAVAEDRRLMTRIGDWVLATAAAQAARWEDEAEHALDMWVNISCDQLGAQHLSGVVERVLAQTGLNTSRLGLEITERQLIGRHDTVRADLTALHELGLRLAVDDFGTGYNSMDYLRRFTFDEIKIDKSFVAGLGHDRADTAVTSSIVALGRSLDLVVVAEGVETQDQHDRLRELGCDVCQGYLLHQPAPPETIDRLLRTPAANTLT
jgi:diguanylate cyclase (GGDEF)-like protein/PAS domain S-box-containing protein